MASLSVWAVGELLSDVLPWKLLAAAVAVFLIAALAHALTIGLYLRLIRSIVATLRLAGRWRTVGGAVAVLAMGVTYWSSVRPDGLPRQLVVEAAYLVGLAIYVARSDLRREVRGRLARVRR